MARGAGDDRAVRAAMAKIGRAGRIVAEARRAEETRARRDAMVDIIGNLSIRRYGRCRG